MKRIKQKAPLPLWLRLVFFFLLLSAVILILFQAIYSYSLDRHLQAYTKDREETLNNQIISSMLEYYATNENWSGIHMPLLHAALSTNTRLLLYDTQERLIADTGQGRHHHRMMTADKQQDLEYAETYQYELGHNNTRIGSLIIAHPLEAEGSAWLQQDLIFQRTLTRSLLWTGLIAISAALVLGILFSRRLSRPLEDFARAAVRITRGDYLYHLPSYNSRELNDLALCFNQMSFHLQELEKLRKRSVADISHELRTPLTTLRSYIEALKDGVISADEKTMGILTEEIMHLNRVAVDMDELARAENARLEQGERKKINLNQFLRDKIASFKPLLQEKRVNLNLRLPETDLIVFLDPGALGKITGNLLDNAYRYTEPGGTVKVSLQEKAELDPAAVPPLGQESLDDEGIRSKLNGMYMITVSDTGKGIKPEHLPYVFERFFRADPSRERGQKQAGSGIGLALVKELIRSAGGFILVTSRPGEGTAFYLYLK